jgi:hypothetical protein
VLHPAFRTHPRFMWIGLLAACVPIIHLLVVGTIGRDPAMAVLIIPLVIVVLVALRWPRIGSLMFVAIGVLLIVSASFSVTAIRAQITPDTPLSLSFWIGVVLGVVEMSLTYLGGGLLFLGASRHRNQTASAALSRRHRSRREVQPVARSSRCQGRQNPAREP